MHLKKRPNFVFNADGTIKSVAQPLINDSGDTQQTPKSPLRPSKPAINAGSKSPLFGKFSTRSGISMSAISGKETKLAFSELGYQI